MMVKKGNHCNPAASSYSQMYNMLSIWWKVVKMLSFPSEIFHHMDICLVRAYYLCCDVCVHMVFKSSQVTV